MDSNLRRSMLLTFALPAIMQSFLQAPAQSLLQGIYSKHAGVALAAIGAAVMLVRVWDAAIDPLIGWLSDRSYPRLRSRKPWLLLGTVISAIGLWFLFRPPPQVSITWFAGWYLVATLGWSLIEVPYRAWSIELTQDHVQRNRVQVWIALGATFGGMAFYLIPIIAKAAGLADTTEFDLGSLALAALLIVILLPLLNLLAVLRVPDGIVAPAPAGDSWRELWRAIAGNPYLLRFLAAYTLASVGAGMSIGVSYLYIDAYLGLSKQFAALTLATLPLTFITIPLWGWISNRRERHRVWGLSIAATAVSFAAMGWVPRGEAGLIPAAIVMMTVAACLFANFVVAPAILGDIADDARLRFGKDRAGVYVACFMLMAKTVQGLAAGFSLMLVGWLGFDATAAEQTAAGNFAIRFVYAWSPSLLMLGAVPIIWNFPLNRTRHAEVVARLNARESGEATPETTTLKSGLNTTHC